jgi:hypothetical protein
MHRYLDFVDSKRAMGVSLRAIVASGAVTQSDTRSRLAGAIAHFLDAGVAAGTLRSGVPADDVVAAMAGAAITAAPEEQREQAERLLDLLLDGLRPR